jgi:hypothetical protein
MRIFSNVSLPHSHVKYLLHNSTYSHTFCELYTVNTYLYRIVHTRPIRLYTYSPKLHLEKDRKYYCYDKFYRDVRPELLGNTTDISLFEGLKQDSTLCEEFWIYYPVAAESGDLIVIQ